MIELHQVSKQYANGHEALKNVNLSIAEGEMVFLTGHSGAGKSTLLKLIAGIEKPTKGRIVVDKHHVQQMSSKQIAHLRRHMGIIFQNPHLLPEYTVFENVALPLKIMGFSLEEQKRRVRAALNKVALLSKEKLHPEELSTGEQQRIGIARAVVHRPKIVLADEPTGNLDPELSLEIMSLFAAFQKVGVTVLVASHDLGLIAGLKNRVITLDHGSLRHPSLCQDVLDIAGEEI